MNETQRTTSRLYLFNPIHQAYVAGDSDILQTAFTRKIAVRQYVYLMFLLAFPIILTITLLVALVGFPIQFLLIVEITVALVACAYFVLRRYLQDRLLRYEGQVIFGEVTRHEVLHRYSNMGSLLVTRIFYRFLTPNNDRIIDFIDLGYVMQRMPDGRKYPEVGTPVAILYANDRNHKLL